MISGFSKKIDSSFIYIFVHVSYNSVTPKINKKIGFEFESREEACKEL